MLPRVAFEYGQSLRAEGEELHEAGKHAESLEKLNEALGLLEA